MTPKSHCNLELFDIFIFVFCIYDVYTELLHEGITRILFILFFILCDIFGKNGYLNVFVVPLFLLSDFMLFLFVIFIFYMFDLYWKQLGCLTVV